MVGCLYFLTMGHLDCDSGRNALSPGTVATDMQVKIKASGINPVSALDPAVHVPAEWPARALLWMCGPEADPWLGTDVMLRDEAVRKAVGLTQ